MSQTWTIGEALAHFDFVTARDDIREIVRRLLSHATSLTKDPTGRLDLVFPDNSRLSGEGPAQVTAAKLPASFAALMKVHGKLLLEGPQHDLSFGCPGVGANGELLDLDFSPEDFGADDDADLQNAVFRCAMFSGQNQVAFRLDEIRANGEPALYLIDHEQGFPHAVWGGFSYTEALFLGFAERVLGQSYLEPLDHERASLVLGDEEYEPSAREIVTSFVEVDELSPTIGRFSHLKELRLRSSGTLRTLPEEIGQLGRLEVLDVCGNELEELPDAIGQLSCLKELSVRRKKFKGLPPSVSRLQNLETLDIQGCFEALPEEIGELAKLKKLTIESHALRSLPASLGKLAALEELTILNGPLDHLPESLGQLGALRTLHLVGLPNLTALPDGLADLTRLHEICLNACASLRDLPDGFSALTELTTFSANQTALDDRAFARLCHARALTSVKLEKTAVTRIPADIAHAPGLRTLDLNGNPITTIATEIAALCELQTLLVNRAELTVFPVGILGLTKLRSLTLRAGQRSFPIPEDIAGMRLDFLTLSHLDITSVPEAVFSLPLKTLQLVDCDNLESLPRAIARCAETLERLWIFRCPRFHEIPPDIAQCLSLREVSLSTTAADEATLRVLATVPGLYDLEVEEHRLAAIPGDLVDWAGGALTLEGGKIALTFPAKAAQLVGKLVGARNDHWYDDHVRYLGDVVALDAPPRVVLHHLSLLVEHLAAVWAREAQRKVAAGSVEESDRTYHRNGSRRFLESFLAQVSRLPFAPDTMQRLARSLAAVRALPGGDWCLA